MIGGKIIDFVAQAVDTHLVNRNEFLADEIVQGFIHYFAVALNQWTVTYTSDFPRIQPEHRNFQVVGVEQALARYAWPASFTAPAYIDGYNYHEGQAYGCYGWDSTLHALTYFRAGLQLVIDAQEDQSTLGWCEQILRWGLGNRWNRTYGQVQQIGENHGGIANYLSDARNQLALNIIDTDNLTAEVIPYASSGLVKIHTLASNDGLIILDSRVSAALGECINHYLGQIHSDQIPTLLRVPRRLYPASRIPTPLAKGVNHPIFTRDHRWIQAQVRVSWLLQAVLQQQSDIFHGDDFCLRAHKLEAALFMMGAQVGPCHHQFPPVPG